MDNGRSIGRLAIELVVIFVGVMGAFFAEDLRQNLEDDRRAQHIYEALLGEVHAFVDRAPLVTADMESRIEVWQEGYDQGERAAPAFYQEPNAEAPPSAIWVATLASGGVALVEPDLFNALATYYNRLESVSDRYGRYNLFTEQSILPLLEDDDTAFYTDDGRLRAEYRAHMRRLEGIRMELIGLTEVGTQLIRSIEANLEA